MTDARIDYVELPSLTAHELTRGFYKAAFGWDFTDYGPDYSATTNGTSMSASTAPATTISRRRCQSSASMTSKPHSTQFKRLAGLSRERSSHSPVGAAFTSSTPAATSSRFGATINRLFAGIVGGSAACRHG